MGRKNSNVRRSNDKGRRARQKAAELPAPGRKKSAPPPIPIEHMVIPDGECYRNPRKPKARFETEAAAAKALRHARLRAAQRGSAHVEKRYYECDFCSGFHLTSRESYNNTWSKP